MTTVRHNSNAASVLDIDPPAVSRRQKRLSRRERPKVDLVEMVDDHSNAVFFDHFEISSTGIYLCSDFLLCPGDEITLKLTLSGRWEPLEVVGEVVRAETGDDGLRPGMSIVFKEMDRKDRSTLERFLARRVIPDAR